MEYHAQRQPRQLLPLASLPPTGTKGSTFGRRLRDEDAAEVPESEDLSGEDRKDRSRSILRAPPRSTGDALARRRLNLFHRIVRGAMRCASPPRGLPGVASTREEADEPDRVR